MPASRNIRYNVPLYFKTPADSRGLEVVLLSERLFPVNIVESQTPNSVSALVAAYEVAIGIVGRILA